MTDEARQFMVALEQISDFQFEASFDWDVAPITLDEPKYSNYLILANSASREALSC